MSLSTADFDRLVERLQEEESRSPGTCRFRAAAIAVLGYLVLCALVGSLAGITALAAWLALYRGIPQLFIVTVISGGGLYRVVQRFRAMRFVPSGIPIGPEDAPELFALLERYRREQKAPPVEKVLLTSAFDASIGPVTAFGPFRPRYYLTLGIPLMDILPPDGLAAVLAHEVGHLSREDGRFRPWIYRLREVFGYFQEQEARSRSRRRSLMGAFLDWYAPYFNAYTFVLARSQEYSADAASARAVGAVTAGNSLLRFEILDLFFGETIEGLLAEAGRGAPEPSDPHGEVLKNLPPRLTQEAVMRRMKECLNRLTHNADTHPSLSDRLKRMGVSPGKLSFIPSLPRPSAFDAFIRPEAAPGIREAFRLKVKSGFDEAWRERRQASARVSQRLIELGPRLASAEAADAEVLEAAALEASSGRANDAKARLERFIAAHPDHALAHGRLGDLLVGLGDPAGVGHLEECARLAPKFAANALFRAGAFLEQQGDHARAKALRLRANEISENARLAAEERWKIGDSDGFAPPEVDHETMARVLIRVSRPEFKRAFLVKRLMTHMPETPAHMIAVEFDVPFYRRLEAAEVQRALQELVAPGLPHDILAVSLSGEYQHLLDSVENIPGALIWTKTRDSWDWILFLAGSLARWGGFAVVAAVAALPAFFWYQGDRRITPEAFAGVLALESLCALLLWVLYHGRVAGRTVRRVFKYAAIAIFGTILLHAAISDKDLDGKQRQTFGTPATILVFAGCAAVFWFRRSSDRA